MFSQVVCWDEATSEAAAPGERSPPAALYRLTAAATAGLEGAASWETGARTKSFAVLIGRVRPKMNLAISAGWIPMNSCDAPVVWLNGGPYPAVVVPPASSCTAVWARSDGSFTSQYLALNACPAGDFGAPG